MSMNFTKLFDPKPSTASYVYQDKITLAVNVALATQRPLLVSGPSGCGKSTLADDVSKVLGWSFEHEVITSRTQAIDLLYRVDNLRKLQDARSQLQPPETYVTPGVLWRAFDPESARTKSATKASGDSAFKRFRVPEPGNGVVVLLDEIDKADPDVPNNLLEAFGSYRFVVDELSGVEVRAQRAPLLVVTTNNERRLPDAFIRRCVDLPIDLPDESVLMSIAEQHFVTELEEYRLANPGTQILTKVAAAVTKTSPWSTAEYLDTLRAIFHLKVAESSENYEELVKITVRKTARAVGQ